MEETRRHLPNLKAHALILGGFVALFWLIELIDWLPGGRNLDGYGVHPRDLSNWSGIFYAPFLHSDFAHVAANTLPFIVLGWLILLRGYRDWIIVSVGSMLASSLGAWLFGQPRSVHIGASGVLFGYFGFLLVRAISERSLKAISAALIVVLMYGSLIWGVLPLVEGVSWQMHLFGFLGGAVLAWVLPATTPAPEDELSYEYTPDLLDHIYIDD